MRRVCLAFVLATLSATVALAQPSRNWCAVPELNRGVVERYLGPWGAPWRQAQSTQFQIPVDFHVITGGRQGQVSAEQLNTLMNNLSWAFHATPFSLLYGVDVIGPAAAAWLCPRPSICPGLGLADTVP